MEGWYPGLVLTSFLAALHKQEVLENNPALDGHCLDPLMDVISKFRSFEDLEQSVFCREGGEEKRWGLELL